jgi:uncharacterized phiE125 gp8 family phage protein
MNLLVYTAPATEPVTVAELKTHLRLDHAADDTWLGVAIQAAREAIEARCRRALVSRTYDGFIDAFPGADWIEIPMPPVASITSVKYYDEGGTQQTLASTVYLLDQTSLPARLYLAPDQQWPSLQDRRNAIAVRFVAGYGAAAAVPAALRLACLMLAADLYEHRGSSAEQRLESNEGFSRLLSAYAVPEVG